jgi:hypothetical protein
LALSLDLAGKSPVLGGAIAGRAALGPLVVVVEGVGASLRLLPDPQGAFGGLAPTLEFRPPQGVGLSIDAGIVKGGGYLFFDFEKGEYAGALQLGVQGLLTMSAIGLISTKMPDGKPGFSLLIIITAEFQPPFQLSYGFTLNGVGGLLGLNRTVLLDPLRDGVRSGAIDGIMFPTDVVANAPRIISDLRAIFPVKEGFFLVGPMAKIGWGTPTLITLSLGVILQLPDPKIAILGVLKMVLPTEEAALLKLQVNFLGTLDLSNRLLTFDASLFDSNLARTMTLTGDMAVRLTWGERPDFVLSAGGFHPEYQPTLPMPRLRRLGISILDLPNARIRAESYFALTSNSVQFGARADCFFGIDDFSVEGRLGFDTLMRFSPFTFKAKASGEFALNTPLGDASIRIRGRLQGPTPWQVKADGSIEVFGIKFEASFEKEWGRRQTDGAVSVALKPLFLAELQKNEVWHTEAAAGRRSCITFKNPVAPASGPVPLRLGPGAALVLSQKLLPLSLRLDKLGTQKLSDVNSIAIASVAVGLRQATLEKIEDNFSAGQFKSLTDAEQLARPSFEKFGSGVRARFDDPSAGSVFGGAVRHSLEYEQIYLDDPPETHRDKLGLSPERFTELFTGSAAQRSKQSARYRERLRKKRVAAPGQERRASYGLASARDQRPLPGAERFPTFTEARDALKALVSRNPALRGQITLLELE